ncbi:MAG: outer membrane protein assembly factor BamA, partial [Sphaerochaetaceae bacterium]|nr:outer membrane protein assembly factor BamA [Sphaerochaetaceae bacterium]
MKKFLTVFLLVLTVVLPLMAQDWYYGKDIYSFQITGLKHISDTDVNNILYDYRSKAFSDELYYEMESRLYNLEGVDFILPEVLQDEEGKLIIAFQFYELPKISSITYKGNERVKSRDITDALATLKVDDYIDVTKKAVIESAKSEVRSVYNTKGFKDIPVELEVIENTEENTVELIFSVTEGIQSRIVEFVIEGNESFSESVLKKQISSKKKSLFNYGFLDEDSLKTDSQNISNWYKTNGYIDAIVEGPIIEEVYTDGATYSEVKVIFRIIEGKQWFYGGIEYSGNEVFSDSEINSVLSMKVGSVLDMSRVQTECSSIADLYYNNGYISSGISFNEVRDDSNMTITYYLDIVEGNQAFVEDILISGLTKTKEYVMRRELSIAPGDIFSKAKLITSAQNLYNTGLLSKLDYDLLYGSNDDNLILQFNLEEGSQMDIQFGATFGGTLSGFPVSGF